MFLGRHKHIPVKTGRRIAAGFRKHNLPGDAWAFLCQGDEHACRCGVTFVLPDGGNVLHELEFADDEEREAVGF